MVLDLNKYAQSTPQYGSGSGDIIRPGYAPGVNPYPAANNHTPMQPTQMPQTFSNPDWRTRMRGDVQTPNLSSGNTGNMSVPQMFSGNAGSIGFDGLDQSSELFRAMINQASVADGGQAGVGGVGYGGAGDETGANMGAGSISDPSFSDFMDAASNVVGFGMPSMVGLFGNVIGSQMNNEAMPQNALSITQALKSIAQGVGLFGSSTGPDATSASADDVQSAISDMEAAMGFGNYSGGGGDADAASVGDSTDAGMGTGGGSDGPW